MTIVTAARMLPQSLLQNLSVVFGALKSTYRLKNGAGVPTTECKFGFQQKRHTAVPAGYSEGGYGIRHEYVHGPGRPLKRLLSTTNDDQEIFAATVHLQAHLRDRTSQERTRGKKEKDEEKGRQGRLLGFYALL